MSYLENWMKMWWPLIKNRPLWNIVLPATHDSGEFSGWNTVFARTQIVDIGEQLALGIRAFDIRIIERNDGVYVMFHTTYPPSGQELSTALEQIISFARNHPYEMIVLKLSTAYGTGNHPEKETPIQDAIYSALQSRLVETSSTNSPTPSDFTPQRLFQRDRNILAYADISLPPTTGANYFWKGKDRNGNFYHRSSWNSDQSDALHTVEEKVDWVKTHIPNWLTGTEPGANNSYVGKYFNTAESCIGGIINIITVARDRVHPWLVAEFAKWSYHVATGTKLNIIPVDGVDGKGRKIINVIEGIIDINQARIPPTPLYQSHTETNEGYFPYYSRSLDDVPPFYKTMDGPAFFVSANDSTKTQLVPIYVMKAQHPDRVRFSLSQTPPGPGWTWDTKAQGFLAYPEPASDRIPVYQYHAKSTAGDRFLYSTSSSQGEGWDPNGPIFYIDNL